MQINRLINFIFELVMLKRIKHEGWRVAGVDNPESVGEHALRAAQIGYFLARMENYQNPDEVVTILVFHDIGECRIGDLHKIANRYCEVKEEQAIIEQLAPIGDLGEEILDRWRQFEFKNTEAGIIAKDADLLEQAFQAHEYKKRGYDTENWIDNVSLCLKTKSAKNLLNDMVKCDPDSWWNGLKKL